MARSKEAVQRDIDWEQEELSHLLEEGYDQKSYSSGDRWDGLSDNMAVGMFNDMQRDRYNEKKSEIESKIAELKKELVDPVAYEQQKKAQERREQARIDAEERKRAEQARIERERREAQDKIDQEERERQNVINQAYKRIENQKRKTARGIAIAFAVLSAIMTFAINIFLIIPNLIPFLLLMYYPGYRMELRRNILIVSILWNIFLFFSLGWGALSMVMCICNLAACIIIMIFPQK